jgi:hypothetical protein
VDHGHIPAVIWVGPLSVKVGSTGQVVALVVGAGIAAATTPLLSSIMGWQTRQQRVRGIALALGVAQTIDGLAHFFHPTIYAANPTVGLACAGNIFYGAGLLGILSVYT